MTTLNTNLTAVSILLSNTRSAKNVDAGNNTSYEAGSFTYFDHTTVTVSQETMNAYAISNIHDQLRNLTEDKVTERLNLLSAGYLGKNHYEDVNKASPTTNPARKVGKVLSSEDYRANYIKENLVNATDALEIFLATSASESNTKKELLAIVNGLKSHFETTENRENYDLIKGNEEKSSQLLKEIELLGFTEVTQLKDGSISASREATNLKKALSELMGLGYILLSHSFDLETGLVNVVFKELDLETI